MYVDDLLITSNDVSCITLLKQQLHDAFTIKDLGLAHYLLGIELARSSSGILLNQRKYVLDIWLMLASLVPNLLHFLFPKAYISLLVMVLSLRILVPFAGSLVVCFTLHSLDLIFHTLCNISVNFCSSLDSLIIKLLCMF